MDPHAIADLPRVVRDFVPLQGQRLYREAYARAMRQTDGDTVRAEELAWQALRGEYFERPDGSWSRRPPA